MLYRPAAFIPNPHFSSFTLPVVPRLRAVNVPSCSLFHLFLSFFIIPIFSSISFALINVYVTRDRPRHFLYFNRLRNIFSSATELIYGFVKSAALCLFSITLIAPCASFPFKFNPDLYSSPPPISLSVIILSLSCQLRSYRYISFASTTEWMCYIIYFPISV